MVYRLLEERRYLPPRPGVLSLANTAVDPFMELKDRLVEVLTPSELDQCTSS